MYRGGLYTAYDGKAVVGKVNVDLHGGIAAQFGVRNIPTIVFLKNGELVDKVVGAVPKEQLGREVRCPHLIYLTSITLPFSFICSWSFLSK